MSAEGHLISVVIPVYNVEKYLRQAVESVINQSYRNLQIILIDDGSTDNSGVICDEYAEKDSRITVVHQKNAGAGAAKNTGLRVATGEYLAFFDSDDFIENDAFEYMVTKLEAYNADVIQCSYRDVYKSGNNDNIIINTGEFNTEEYLTLFTSEWTCGLLWDKIYKRKLFNNIFFEVGHIVDDDYFTYQGIMNAKKIVRDSHIVYNYRKRASSVSYLPLHMERILFDRLDYLGKRLVNISYRYPDLKQVFETHYLNMLIWLVKDPFSTDKSLNEIKNLIRSYLKNNNTKISFSLRLNLMKILLSSNKRLLSRKNALMDNKCYEDYFD